MTTTDFIATLALVTSIVSITYTIVVDRRRPRLKVRGGIAHVIDRNPVQPRSHGPYFQIAATNLGPGKVCVNGIGLTYRSNIRRLVRSLLRRKDTHGVVLEALPESPHQLPKWLDVGESLTLFYPPDSQFLEEHEFFDCFYLYDSIGGEHWAPKNVFKEARQSREKVEKRKETTDP